jgi:2'-5' RNA ligase
MASDIVSLELVLDPGTETRIRSEWAALAEAGLSSLGAHTAPSNRPHITVMVRAAIGPLERAELEPLLSLPIPIELGGLLLFGAGDRRVLARSVVVSEHLLRAHRALHAVVGPGADAPHTRPGEWSPHVTLARRLRADSLPEALRALDEVGATEVPHGALVSPTKGSSGSVIGLRRWDAASATVTMLL